jgi:hypothetical protein
MKLPASELAWRLADYRAAKAEPPARCVSNPDLTEGEMMTADEVEEFVKDSIATLRILADKQSPRFADVAATFKADVAYLVECGTLEQDEAEALAAESNLRF